MLNSTKVIRIFVIVVICAIHVDASGIGDVRIRLNGGGDIAQIGTDNVVEVWIRNDARLQGMTLGLQFSCDCDFTLVSDHGSVGFVDEVAGAAGVWSFGGLVVRSFVDGSNADSVLFGGASDIEHGLPVHSSYELCYTLGLYIPAEQAPMASGLRVDNIFVPPAGEWMFVDDQGAYAPMFCGDANSSTMQPDAATARFDVCLGTNCGTCCAGRVGDANASGDDEPTIGDIGALIDALFLAGTCDGVIQCMTEADLNQSGGTDPICDDITISDIGVLISYMFINGPWDPVTNPEGVLLPECL